MQDFLTTRIYLRTNRANKKGELPIYFRFTIAGKRKEVSSNVYTSIQKWDNQLLKIKGNSEDARIKNSLLDIITMKANKTMIKLSISDATISIDDFFNHFQGITEKPRTIVPIFKTHNQKLKDLIDKEYTQGTYDRYETTLAHLQKFLQWKYFLIDIDITKIDIAFINDFDFYLRTIHKCSNNTTVKYIKNFNKILRICILNEWISKDHIQKYKSKIIVIEKIYLSQQEIDTIISKEIKIYRLALVRDIFIFACYTGLAYIDVKQLTMDNIVKGIDGTDWINTHRQKTHAPSNIPLLDIPKQIIEKYTHNPKANNEGSLLPTFSNQKMNAYLKEIADICKINKILTFHIARHTFATTITLSNGVPIESVSKMLGHKNIKITQHYAKITDRKVANDMENLKDKINKTHQKVIKITNR